MKHSLKEQEAVARKYQALTVFWRFYFEKQQITPSLEGVIISEECSNYSYFEALATPYLYEDFLPKLKEFCKKNLGCFGGEANA